MLIFRSMIDRHIKILVLTDGKYSDELKEMGFGHAATIEEAIAHVRKDLPRADVAAALNAKVLVGISSPK